MSLQQEADGIAEDGNVACSLAAMTGPDEPPSKRICTLLVTAHDSRVHGVQEPLHVQAPKVGTMQFYSSSSKDKLLRAEHALKKLLPPSREAGSSKTMTCNQGPTATITATPTRSLEGAAVAAAATSHGTLTDSCTAAMHAHAATRHHGTGRSLRAALQPPAGIPVSLTPFRTFPLQQQAYDYVDQQAEPLQSALRVYAEEVGEGGKRRFIATTTAKMWAVYEQLQPSQRHHYEIIRQGSPCHLYFDLEYVPSCNPGLDGNAMTQDLLELVRDLFKERFGIKLKAEWVLELDSSTASKFSRHLLVRIRRAAFKDNSHVNAFVALLVERVLELGKVQPRFAAFVVHKEPRPCTTGQELHDEHHGEARQSAVAEAQAGTSGHAADLMQAAPSCAYQEQLPEPQEQLRQQAADPQEEQEQQQQRVHLGSAAPHVDLFIDTAVYTRNRAFRLFLSSKFGKQAVLKATSRFGYHSIIGTPPQAPAASGCDRGTGAGTTGTTGAGTTGSTAAVAGAEMPRPREDGSLDGALDHSRQGTKEAELCQEQVPLGGAGDRHMQQPCTMAGAEGPCEVDRGVVSMAATCIVRRKSCSTDAVQGPWNCRSYSTGCTVVLDASDEPADAIAGAIMAHDSMAVVSGSSEELGSLIANRGCGLATAEQSTCVFQALAEPSVQTEQAEASPADTNEPVHCPPHACIASPPHAHVAASDDKWVAPRVAASKGQQAGCTGLHKPGDNSNVVPRINLGGPVLADTQPDQLFALGLPKEEDIQAQKDVFFASLVCHVDPCCRLLSMYSEADGKLARYQGTIQLPGGPRADAVHGTVPHIKARGHATLGAAAVNYGPSQYPLVDAFVESVCTKGGVQGKIRSWALVGGSSILYNIKHNRWCDNINAAHKSNGIYFIVDTESGVWYQKCYDPSCRLYRSGGMPLPRDIWESCGRTSSARAAPELNKCLHNTSPTPVAMPVASEVGMHAVVTPPQLPCVRESSTMLPAQHETAMQTLHGDSPCSLPKALQLSYCNEGSTGVAEDNMFKKGGTGCCNKAGRLQAATMGEEEGSPAAALCVQPLWGNCSSQEEEDLLQAVDEFDQRNNGASVFA